TGDDVRKLSVRDLPLALATGCDGATTVASTAAIAARCGISVFATGGLGGVHRGAAESYDESADLIGLSRTPVTVVCAGVKSILDVGATLERLETLSVPVVGFGTDRFPGFYLRDSGFTLDWQVGSAAEVAGVMAARESLGVDRAALVVANPLPESVQLDPAMHDRVLQESLAGLAAEGITGKAVTPYLLDRFHRGTGGASLEVNIEIILRNAAVAADIAAAHRAGHR
ncbi:MAG: pseudouridine-5'-phosphate glycosidase, partial [Propionibacteriaceae bacterium]